MEGKKEELVHPQYVPRAAGGSSVVGGKNKKQEGGREVRVFFRI